MPKSASERRSQDARPNLIFMITDQQRYDTIRTLGFPHMQTPNLDRLADQGVAFTNCFITAPSCAPSRASLFTGSYSHTNGVFVNNRDPWRHSWVENLADAGYYCVNIGKMHTSPWDTPCGFHERYVVENKDRFRGDRWFFDEWDRGLRTRGHKRPSRDDYAQWPDWESRLGAYEWKLPPDLHPDVFVGDMACWWIEQQRDRWWKDVGKLDMPLFLQIGFPGPHPPYDPLPEYAEHYLKQKLPIVNAPTESIQSQPQGLQALRQSMLANNPDSIRHLSDPTAEQRHRQRAYYLANVTMIDEKIGEVLQSLEDNGYLENAVVVFTSDHGDSLGDHGHSQKWNMYDEVVRVPTIFWNSNTPQSGRKVDELVELFDIGPTLLELAGVTPPEWMEAVSLVPLLEGRADACGKEYVFAEHARDDYLPTIEFMTMVRGRRWKLVHFAGEIEGQLFDLQSDPHELNDLWDDPNHSEKKAQLLAVLREWLIRSHVKTHGRYAASR